MWTIFGAGNLIWDIIDTVYAYKEDFQIVLNCPVEVNLEFCSKKIAWDAWKEDGSKKIFGYLNPDKSFFLDKFKIFDFSNLLHPSAYIARWTSWGQGNYFAPHSTIAPNVTLQNFNYVNRNASIGHDTQIGSFNHIGPGATVCGRCQIGSRNFIGAGSVIKDGVIISDGVTVGAGAVVVKDLLYPEVYVGNPAKILVSKK